MIILAIDPGHVTGICVLDTKYNVFAVSQIDNRGENKETISLGIVEEIETIYSDFPLLEYTVDVVAEDFVLRHGQAVDISPMHALGAIDVMTDFQTHKYLPAAHKSGNKAYDINKMIKDEGFKMEGDHKADALSLAIHHYKIVDTKGALNFVKGYKK